MNERLYRSVDDRVLAGVAGGLAERMGMDPSIVRIIWALLVIASGGIFLLIYIVMAIVVPEEDDLAAFPPYPPVSPAGSPPGAAMTGSPGEVPAAGSPDAGAAASAAGAQAAPTPGYAPPAMTAAQWRGQARAARRAARAARRAERGPSQASVVFGVILILIGVWFLLREYVPGFDFDRLWPFALLVLGVVLLAFSFGGRGGPSGGPGEGTR